MRFLTHILQSCFALLEIEKYIFESSERLCDAIGVWTGAGIYIILASTLWFISVPIVLPARIVIKLIGNNKRVNEVFSEYSAWKKSKIKEQK